MDAVGHEHIPHTRGRGRRRGLVLALLATAALLVGPTAPAAAAPAFQMPFPCGDVWGASTYANHDRNGSANSVDWNLPGTANGDLGRTVLAGASGVVRLVAFQNPGYGHHVVVDHGAGWSSLYAHLERVDVVKGARVDARSRIGTVGTSGISPAAVHLHYEQRYNDVPKPVVLAGQRIAVGATPPGVLHESRNCGTREQHDYTGDGRADLFVVPTASTGSGRTEVHVLDARSGYTTWALHAATAAGYLRATDRPLFGDVDGDGRVDLLVVSTADTQSGRTEVHVLDGASGFTTWSLNRASAAGYLRSTDHVHAADVDRDGRVDLVVVSTAATGSGRTEVHVLDGASGYTTWSRHAATAADHLRSTDRTHVGDHDGDGETDLLVVPTQATGSGRTEVHVLDGSSGFTRWSLHAATAAGYLRTNDRTVAGDQDGDGRVDLLVVPTVATGSGRTEVHALGGAGGFASWTLHVATAADHLRSTDLTP